MKKVITYGTFDTLHFGHIRLLKRARALGDYLIVAVSTDEFNKSKGKRSHFPYKDRVADLAAIKWIDRIIPEHDWEQKRRDIKDHGCDTFVIGDDWKGEFDDLADLCNVIYLPRTEGISSTVIKSAIAPSIPKAMLI